MFCMYSLLGGILNKMRKTYFEEAKKRWRNTEAWHNFENIQVNQMEQVRV